MFDTYISPRPRTEYVTREVNITEKRAPTDESVKLLREMEQAADAKRIAAMKLEGNSFNGCIEVWQEPAQGYMIFARAAFDINGKRCVAKASVDEAKPDGWHKVELMQALHTEIAKAVASEVLGDCMGAVKW